MLIVTTLFSIHGYIFLVVEILSIALKWLRESMKRLLGFVLINVVS